MSRTTSNWAKKKGLRGIQQPTGNQHSRASLTKETRMKRLIQPVFLPSTTESEHVRLRSLRLSGSFRAGARGHRSISPTCPRGLCPCAHGGGGGGRSQSRRRCRGRAQRSPWKYHQESPGIKNTPATLLGVRGPPEPLKRGMLGHAFTHHRERHRHHRRSFQAGSSQPGRSPES